MRPDLPIRHVIQKLDCTGDALPAVTFLAWQDGDWRFIADQREEFIFENQAAALAWVDENRHTHAGDRISLIVATYRQDARGREHTLPPVMVHRITPEETYAQLETRHLA
jgi:hypothetical protein